jgi:hypothetical protein
MLIILNTPRVTLEDCVRHVRIMEAARERPLLTELTDETRAS